MSSIFIFPYIMPQWTLAVVWQNLFNSNAVTGTSNGLLAALFGIEMPLWWCKGMFPSLMVLGLHYAPFAYTLIGGIFQNMDANLEEAATILDTPKWRIMTRITLPMVTPAILSTILLVFGSAMGSYPVPHYLGLTTLSTKYVSMNSKYTGEASILAIIMMIFGVSIMLLNQLSLTNRKNYTTVTGKSGQSSKFNLGKVGKYVIAIALVVLTFFTSIFPIISFAFETFLPNPGDYSFLYTAKKLFGYHLEKGADAAALVKELEEKVASAKAAQSMNEEFELLKDGNVVTEVRKLTKEEIDLSVRRVSRIVKIGMFMDRYPAELSGGQQQRVAIARTLAPEPSVLFMDEPLSNLDAKLRLEMRYELQRLHVETGSTFVYVTHDQMEAMTLATQICLIDNGVLQQYDAPLTVYGQPNNLFVADFVGNPSINFVEAKGVQKGAEIDLAVFNGRKATFVPNEPLDLAAWFANRDAEIEEKAAALKEKAAQKGYVEKGNKDEPFRYHIARVDEVDDSLLEEPVLTNEDFVVGIRPEFIDITDGNVEGEIYGAMPTGMESTIKIRLDDFLLAGVVFGSTLFTIGSKVKLHIKSDDILLFDRASGKCIASGRLILG